MAEGDKTAGEAPAEGAEALEGGSYDVIRGRLIEQAAALGKKAEWLNTRRTEVFGASQLALLATERVRTENNCVPRDIRQVQGKLLFGFNVFIGLKTETLVSDVFAVHELRQTDTTFELPQLPIEPGHYLADPAFVKEFSDLYRYTREAKLLQIQRSDTRLLAVFQIGASPSDRKIFRWGIDKAGNIVFIDSRGEEDFAPPKQHDFVWTPCTRDDQVPGENPHFSILDEVFVETVGGDLTVKIENNTKDGRGIYREPVEDANQSLDDSDIAYVKLGALILLKIKPYRENAYRYLVFNTRTQGVVRIDSIESACVSLPEDQGIIFPGGYYLRTGEYKVFDGDSRGLTFRRAIKSPNGEDILYVFERVEDGFYLLLPYNLIRKEVQNPLLCQGYSVFDDGKMIVFRTLTDEASKVHPMQIWQTPFCTQEFAAAAPTDGSYLAKLGNAELVRGISEMLTLQRVALSETPTRQSYEDVIATARRIMDAHHWVAHEEAGNVAEAISALKKTAESIIDEFEKVAAIRKRATEALAAAEDSQDKLFLGLRPDDMRSVEEFMGALSDLRKQRGQLITLKEMRYMDLAKVDGLEKRVVEEFELVSKSCVAFLLTPTALAPLVKRLGDVVDKVGVAKKATELKPHREDVDRVGEGLTVLSDVINGLNIEDPTQRTRILEGISEAFSQLNRARATLAARKKELSSAEGKGEFVAQFKLFGQSVTSALALCDTPEKCDAELSRLLLGLEELEGKFSEFDEFIGELTQKREEVTEAIAAKRQQLLDERQKRAQNILGAAERIIAGVVRKSRTLSSADELNTYFASDAMILKLRDLTQQLFAIGATVKGDEVEAKLKSARQDALRALRDKTELFDGGADVIKLGKHRFNVNTQPVELALVPRRDEGAGLDVQYTHITGTDFYERIEDPLLEASRDLWDQSLPSESADVYRGEYLAASVFFAAEKGEGGLSLASLTEAGTRPNGILEVVRAYAQDRHEEGYERGVHDVDAAIILEKLVAMKKASGLLRYGGDARALACLTWASLGEVERGLLSRRARSFGRLKERLASSRAQDDLAREVERDLRVAAELHRFEIVVAGERVPVDDATVRVSARYLVEELSAERPRFVTSASATTLRDALSSEIDRASARRDFDEDLRFLEKHPAERLGLVRAWLEALVARHADLTSHAQALLEACVLVATDRRIEREPSSAVVESVASGLLGQHPLIQNQSLTIRLDAFLGRLERTMVERVPRFRAFRKTKQELLERERRRLRLDEFTPRILSSFVRNRLIDEVYLPLVGDNLAKQMGAAGDSKRTDLMGLLLLISPPGYGKTTLMEYVANKLGLIFMKVNGPALGHDVRSLDPEEAPNATARQEVDKINLALEMGNNVMLYLDDIQHTHPELLQKFISLCDAQRRIEGVWKKRTRTYDLRGKKFCVVMAGNPYTESGDKFKIPDMLANRADTYNLGDILEGKDHLFALSYIENALTSNKALASLSGREPADIHKIIRMSEGEAIPVSELAYPYSAAEVNEMVEVLRRLSRVQKVLLQVNLEYIASASQDDAYRTEPPFKLQGSYRNMNKIAEKIVAAHTEAEVDSLIDDHYAGESQTLTTGAEQNLLKLASMRGRLSEEGARRWEEIKKGFVRVKMMGGKDDDPVARVTGALGTLGSQLDGIGKTLNQAVAQQRTPAEMVAKELDKLHAALAELASRELMVKVERDPAIAELLAQQLGTVESSLAPVVHALAQSLAQAGAHARLESEAQAAALSEAVSEATAQVRAVSQASAQIAGQQAAQAVALREAEQVARETQNAVIAAQQMARQVVATQQAGLQQAQQVAQQAQQVAQHAQQMARDAAMRPPTIPPGQIGLPGFGPAAAPPPPGHGQGALVQRPGASAEENEAIARAQQAIAQARSQGTGPEVGAAVQRVEQRLGELTSLVKGLQGRIGQAAAAVAGNHPRYDAAIDLESASNFYRWRKNGDVVREGGVFVASYRPAPNLGSTVALRMSLPGGVELETLGVVEWSRPAGDKGPPWTQPGFGARFADLSPDAQQLVRQFVLAREPILFEPA